MANRYSFETNVQDVLDDNSVSTSMIVDANVTANKLATDSVTTVKIVDANVTAAKLATDSVTTAKIVDSNVTTAKIADANVTAIKLAADSVTTVKILDSNVTTPKLADGAVTPVKADLTAIWAFTTSPTVPTPTTGTQVANKNYVDSVSQGLDVKASVRAATTANISVATAPASIDGVTLATNDRILLKNQTSAVENGIWVFNGTGNALTRATDMAAGSSAAGVFTFVEEGTTYADTGWICTTDRPNDVVGTNSLTFTQFSGATLYTFRDGLTQSGANVDVNPGAGLVITGGATSGGSVKIGFAGEGWGDITFRGTSVWERLAPTTNGLLQSNGSGANPSWITSISDTQHGTRGGGTLHAVATTSVAGFMSAADKTTLDSITTELSIVDTGSTVGATTDTLSDYIVPLDTSVVYEVVVKGRDSAGLTNGYRLFGTFKNVSGTVTQIGSTSVMARREDAGLGAASATLVISGTTVQTQVTGVAAKTITWRTRATVL